MFSINIRVAFSVFVIFTVSASAIAFSASARAFLSSLRMLSRPPIVATRPVPTITLRISLHPLPRFAIT